MKDALGGVFNIWFVAVFLVFISGYLAFSVSYSKAFKVKNKIISAIEQYQGYDNSPTSPVNIKIEGFIDEIGYNRDINSADSETRAKNWKGDKNWQCQSGYCVAKTYVDGDANGSATGRPKCYYSVVTFVHVPIPVFEKVLPYLSFFQTSGDTMTIYEN